MATDPFGPLHWAPEQLAVFASAMQRAQAGVVTVLSVEGEGGVGKTALLEEIVRRAAGFRVLRGEGVEIGDPAPFDLLAGWGVELSQEKGVPSHLLAARRLREVIDEDRKPVLLVIDDLQWIDPESVEVLASVLARNSADRLLVCAAARPLAPGTHPGWQRWAAGQERGLWLSMTGMAWPQARALVHETQAEITELTARALWEHTSGNPLYLRALITEFHAADLSRMRVLPAPTQFAQVVSARLHRLSDGCTQLARATAVLGTEWHSLADVAELAQLDDAAELAQPLVDAGLLDLRADGATSVRVSHALVRAAVYQHTPLPQRQALHARAAEIVTGVVRIFDHRIAAARQYDDALAQELDDYAAQLHAGRSHRLASAYLRSASALTRAPRTRERRWLDALFEKAQCSDRAVVHDELAEAEHAADVARATLVRATLAAFERRNDTAVALITPLLAPPHAPVDPTTRYRLEAVLVWARIMAGHPTGDIKAGLDRLAALGPKDPVLAAWLRLFAGWVAARGVDTRDVTDVLAHIPDNPGLVTSEDTPLLALRGSLRASCGPQTAAIADLAEVVRRVQDGVSDLGGGSFHAMLARAYWFDGQWARARATMHVAADLTHEHPHPFVAALAPVIEVGDGNLDRADALIDNAQDILRRAPYVEAGDLLTVSRAIRLHAAGSTESWTALFDDVSAAVTALTERRLRKDAIWLVHVGLTAVRAGELAAAEECVHALDDAMFTGRWIEPMSKWLQGLISEARGDDRLALQRIRAAAAPRSTDNLPLYRAHVLVDLGRLAHRLRDTAGAEDAVSAARRIYRHLGATAYVVALDRRAAPPRPRGDARAITLTERERDVVALVVAGMSYAQIARELLVTQSTVGYHLSNVYGKAAVSSRHQLIEAVRRDPRRFALGAR